MSSLRDQMRDQAEEAGEFNQYPPIEFVPPGGQKTSDKEETIATQSVAGEVTGWHKANISGDETIVCELDDDEYGMVTVFFGATRLRTEFENNPPEIGQLLFLECYGVDPEFRNMKLFRIARSGKRGSRRNSGGPAEQQVMDTDSDVEGKDEDTPF